MNPRNSWCRMFPLGTTVVVPVLVVAALMLAPRESRVAAQDIPPPQATLTARLDACRSQHAAAYEAAWFWYERYLEAIGPHTTPEPWTPQQFEQ